VEALRAEIKQHKRIDYKAIYSFYTAETQKDLFQVLAEVDRTGVREILIVGLGRNTLELLLIASEFPAAKITVVDPNYANFMRDQWESFLEDVVKGLIDVANVDFRQSSLENYPPKESADLIYVSGVISDLHIFPRFEQFAAFADALLTNIDKNTQIVSLGIHPPWLPHLESLGLKTASKVGNFFRLTHQESSPTQVERFSNWRPFGEVAIETKQPNGWSTFSVGNWIFFLHEALDSVKTWYFAAKTATAMKIPINMDERILYDLRTLDYVVSGPEEHSQWQIRLKADQTAEIAVSAEAMDLILRGGSLGTMGADSKALQNLKKNIVLWHLYREVSKGNQRVLREPFNLRGVTFKVIPLEKSLLSH
jgi:hypothetical protein